jgi:hypothetical protein
MRVEMELQLDLLQIGQVIEVSMHNPRVLLQMPLRSGRMERAAEGQCWQAVFGLAVAFEVPTAQDAAEVCYLSPVQAMANGL